MQTVSMKLPDIGEGVTEAELVEWYVKIGDIVREDDVLADVMTDKATVEVPSVYAGKVTWLGGEVGDILAIGADLIEIETDAREVDVVLETSQELEEVSVSGKAVKDDKKVLAAPSVRKFAAAAGIDLQQVVGSGPGGRITLADLDGGPKKQETTEVKIVGLRRKIAERMSLANSHIPHITIIEEIDVTDVEEQRAKLNDTRDDKPKLTLLPFILKALTLALREHPEMNANFDDEAETVTRFNHVHAGIATMTENGLMVPVVHDVEGRDVWNVAAEISRLAENTRDGNITRSEMSGATITVTSLGPLGALATTPIINPPEVAIIGINKIAMRPSWNGREFVPRKMMNLSCSFDHRVIDGWDAATFISVLKSHLEAPENP